MEDSHNQRNQMIKVLLNNLKVYQSDEWYLAVKTDDSWCCWWWLDNWWQLIVPDLLSVRTLLPVIITVFITPSSSSLSSSCLSNNFTLPPPELCSLKKLKIKYFIFFAGKITYTLAFKIFYKKWFLNNLTWGYHQHDLSEDHHQKWHQERRSCPGQHQLVQSWHQSWDQLRRLRLWQEHSTVALKQFINQLPRINLLLPQTDFNKSFQETIKSLITSMVFEAGYNWVCRNPDWINSVPAR